MSAQVTYIATAGRSSPHDQLLWTSLNSLKSGNTDTHGTVRLRTAHKHLRKRFCQIWTVLQYSLNEQLTRR